MTGMAPTVGASYHAAMTVLERVEDFITRLAPKPVCDDCIADSLKITPRQHANARAQIWLETSRLNCL
jgi:hypothetical protein